VTRVSRDDWEQHWRDYNETAERNPAQDYRRELIVSLLDLADSGKGARILDIGSGQGDMAATLRAEFPAAQILGLELSETGISIARRKVKDARFVQRNLLEALEPPPDLRGWATHAVCSEVIEHVDEPALLLRNVRAYMDPTCRLILTAPGGPMSAFDRHIGHRKHWRRDEIETMLRAAGYTAERVTGAGFPFFNLYRCIVILRGKKLIADAAAGSVSQSSTAARAAMAIFRRLIRPNLNSSRWGWQMIANCRRGV
jgi:cyclopropane fatty-acyl-phospholipid synthase-like methyltransferase